MSLTWLTPYGEFPEAQLLEHLAHEPGSLVWGVSRRLQILVASEQASMELVGLPPEQVVGRMLQDFAPPETVRRMTAMLDALENQPGRIVGSGMWKGVRRMTLYLSLRAIHASTRGFVAITRPAPLGTMDDRLAVDEADFVDLGPLSSLSTRELEVLALFGQGLRLRQIAMMLQRSHKTIENHQAALSRKLGVSDRARLTAVARDAGLTIHHASLHRTDPRHHGRDERRLELASKRESSD